MTWSHEKVLVEVQGVIREHAEVDIALTETTELVADLGIDSLGVMEVVADIEDKFEMNISDSDLREVVTLGDVVKQITMRLERAGKLEG